MTVLLASLVAIVIALGLLLARNIFGVLLSDDKVVVAGVAGIMPLVALFQIGDGMTQRCVVFSACTSSCG